MGAENSEEAVRKAFYYYQDSGGNALFFKQLANKIILVGE